MPAPNVSVVANRNAGIGASGAALPAQSVNDILFLFHESPNGANVVLSNAQAFVEAAPPSPQATGVAEGAAATKGSAFWARSNGALVAPTIGAQVDHFCTGVLAIAGAIQSGTPWNAQAGAVAAAATTVVSCPGLTTLSDQSLVLFIIFNATDLGVEQVSAFTPPSDLSNFGQVLAGTVWQTNSGNGGGISVFAGVKDVAGPVNAFAATLANASVQGLLTLAITPQVLGSLGGSVVVPADLVSISFID